MDWYGKESVGYVLYTTIFLIIDHKYLPGCSFTESVIYNRTNPRGLEISTISGPHSFLKNPQNTPKIDRF